jgi:hypothetical protein
MAAQSPADVENRRGRLATSRSYREGYPGRPVGPVLLPSRSRTATPLDRPSENITGFVAFQATLGGKWLEPLSEIAQDSLKDLGASREGVLSSRTPHRLCDFISSALHRGRRDRLIRVTMPSHASFSLLR